MNGREDNEETRGEAAGLGGDGGPGRADVDTGPDERDADLLDDGDDVESCPECGGEVYVDSERCPDCGHWLTSGEGSHIREDAEGAPWQAWVIVIAVVALILLFVFGR